MASEQQMRALVYMDVADELSEMAAGRRAIAAWPECATKSRMLTVAETMSQLAHHYRGKALLLGVDEDGS